MDITIYEQIRQRRKFLKLKQGELADRCGISRQHLVNIENRHSEPTFMMLDKISTGLDCQLIITIIPK